MPRTDTRNWSERRFVPGSRFAVRWVDNLNVESEDDDLRYQGCLERGAARFARGEGCWWGREAALFACTNGGRMKKGQTWRCLPIPDEGISDGEKAPGQLELFIRPDDGSLVENADNLIVAPWGDLILAKDGVSPQFVVGVTPEGRICKVARTTLSELTGACFSPDGTTLFVSIQVPGLTLANSGP